VGREKIASVGGIVTSVLAASCCLGPALFLAFGITGLGFLARLSRLRPYFIALTLVLVCVAYYYAYGRGAVCGSGGTCTPAAQRINRFLFWLLVAFAIFGAAFPYVVELLLG